MLHELQDIIRSAKIAKTQGLKTVLASVVSLEGSSYRRPGVRMSIQENGKMIGAVSGGCVEKEILRQARSVFETNTPKLIEYDGRYRLGCEGILYILIEPFNPEDTFYEAFEKQCNARKPFSINTFYSKEESSRLSGGSVFNFSEVFFSVSEVVTEENLDVFPQTVKAGFKLIIVGSEHDAVQLCNYASTTGWEVAMVAPTDDPKAIDNFPGASKYLGIDATTFGNLNFDSQTAIMLMTHSYVKDLTYLSELVEKDIRYIGLLGPSKRREKLLNELLEKNELLSENFFANIYGPSGINIGAETPQEIAISIIAEILSVFRNQKPIPLKDKQTGIHQ